MPAVSSQPNSRVRSPRRRWPWIFAGGFLLGGLATLALLLTPAAQAWLLRRIVASQPGWRLDLQKFSAGPTGLELDGLNFAMPGVNARTAPIAVRIAPGRLLNKRELKIERIEARKLLVTLTPADLPSSSSEPFSGLLTLLQSPLAWALDDAQLDGEIAVREGNTSLVVGAFTIHGGGLSADKPGEFTYELAVNSSLLPLAPEHKIRSRGTVRLTQTTTHAIREVHIEGDLTLPRYGLLALPVGKFTVTATTAKNGPGETYHARLDLGSAGTFEFSGQLDATRAHLAGRAAVRAHQALVASLAGENFPQVAVDAAADFAIDLRRGDVDITLAGNLDARDWARLHANLSVVAPLRGQLAAALTRRAGKVSLDRLDATLRAETADTPATLRLALTQPIDLAALPPSPLATLTLERLPLAWANPWLTTAALVLDPADLNAAWQLSLSADRTTFTFSPTRPLAVSTVALKGAKLPPLPSLALSLSPRLTISATRATLAFDDFSATTTQGDRLSLHLDASYDFAKSIAQAAGELSGAVPTLLSGADRPLPFTLNARWDAALTSTSLQIKTLELTARHGAGTAPHLALQLLQPLTLDLDRLTTPTASTAADLAQLTFDRLPLSWISRWIAPRELSGTLASGHSLVRASPDGKLTFTTTAPWRLADATFGLGGKVFFAGEASIAPSLAVHAGRYTAELHDIAATHRDGSRIRGSISAEANLADKKASTTLALDAELPALPHSEKTFGPLFAQLRATSHNETDQIAVVDAFELRVRNRDRELFALAAPAPFLAGLSRSGMLTVGTVAPLTLTTGEIPLAWLQPWFPSVEAEGILQPAELQLTAQLTKFLLRPIKPVHVRDFSARIAGRDIARDMEFSFYPGLDLTLICIPAPTFQLAYSGTAHLTNGAVNIAGERAVDVDAAVSFLGNDQTALPSGLDYTTRADFAQLSRVPALAATGIPSRGTLVARLNGDLLGQAPLELWARLEDLPRAAHPISTHAANKTSSTTLPPLEITAHGKVSREQTVAADIALQLETQPRSTDASFQATLNLAQGNLEIASALRSQHFDAAEALALWEGLYAPTPLASSPTIPATTASPTSSSRAPTYPQLGVPFWSHLRGHFDLDLGTVRYAPYQIDHVRGRLDLRDRELALSNLTGEMFAGRWSGHARIAYDPANKTADHTTTGEFKIEQFDSARVVQTVFPTELASVDAKIDVHSAVRSQGNALLELIDRAEADFTAESRQGLVRLTVPKQELASTAAVFGGTILLSPELRALGRLLKKFAEMPVDELRISGARRATGDVHLTEFRLDSPQARLLAQGRIPAIEGEPLMNRPLELSIDLAAKDEMAVILGGMSLIEKKPRPDGYRPLKEKFDLRGKAGEPDTRPLYDLLAKAVLGSKGTWGFLMRKVQDQVNKAKPAPVARPAPAS